MFSVRTADLYKLLDKKMAQLTIKHRHLLRGLLREFFGRIPEEELDEIAKIIFDEGDPPSEVSGS